MPGLADEVRSKILDRAEGVPLYAVETVRMLLDKGLLDAHDNAYRLTGSIETLDVPETLHALDAQSRPPQRVVAVDTGSKDLTPSLLGSALGRQAVLRRPRETGFGAAVP